MFSRIFTRNPFKPQLVTTNSNPDERPVGIDRGDDDSFDNSSTPSLLFPSGNPQPTRRHRPRRLNSDKELFFLVALMSTFLGTTFLFIMIYFILYKMGVVDSFFWVRKKK